MPANTDPIFTLTPRMEWKKFKSGGGTGYTDIDNDADSPGNEGTGANTVAIGTMGANGGYVTRLTFKSMGTNAVGVARVFINNGSDKTTIANNALIAEMSLPVTTESATTWTTVLELPLMRQLPAGYVVYVGCSSSSFTEGWSVVCEWGDY